MVQANAAAVLAMCADDGASRAMSETTERLPVQAPMAGLTIGFVCTGPRLRGSNDAIEEAQLRASWFSKG